MKSNCLFEAIRAKIRDPEVTIKMMSLKKTHGFPHFYWKDKDGYHQYKAKGNEPIWQVLWFEGEFKHHGLNE